MLITKFTKSLIKIRNEVAVKEDSSSMNSKSLMLSFQNGDIVRA